MVSFQSALLALALSSSLAGASDCQQLSGHIPKQARGLAPIGRLAPTTRLSLAISLPLRHADELNQLLREIYDPAGPNSRHYLGPEEFARRFGPAPQDYAAVQAFCRSNGLVVTATHPNRTVLDVIGPVNAIESAFHTTLCEYRHPTENRTFYAPETEPTVALAAPILHVAGLDNLNRPRPLSKRIPPDKADKVTSNSSSGVSGSFLGADFRAAYAPGVSLTGSGQTLALVEMDGYYANDITAYEKRADLPAVPLQVVPVDNFNEQPGSGNGEAALDIQMAIAMAPGLKKILVYEESTNSSAIDLLNKIATDDLAPQISCSWTWGTYDPGTDQTFLQYAAQGQTFFQASGDSGAYFGAIGAPADNPHITVVGGTTLSTTSQGVWAAETAWNNQLGDAAGGGYSTIYTLPSWQSGLNMNVNLGSTTRRNIPDVAMIAANVETISDDGKTYQVSGTSIAAPLWAAFIALANQQAVTNGQSALGFLNPALYTLGEGGNYLAAFHDITSGNNAVGPSGGFPAVANYDLCTGWGTPMGSNTIRLILQIANSQIDHFSWASIQGPITAGSPSAVTLTAQTAANTTAAGFSGTANLSAAQIQTNTLFSRDFDTGTLSDWVDQGTYDYYIDTTTGAAGTKQSLTLIGGNTNTSYTLAQSLASDSGSLFNCVVANTGGTVSSQSSKLTVRPAFGAGALSAAGSLIRLTFNGTTGSNYVVLVSTNLQTWTPLTTVQVSDGTAGILDTNAGPRRFYRIEGE
jgi:subtilase family serine protease